ncbi:unnamed protein product [Gordionus sp. m RMFG-2023]|uniref:lysophosphatidic acid phosphatase type 6-like n=1 Tax=Gordionus sp. m RMFG-2023 TaxID=3053472 RepID=UPI0030E46179
MKRSIKNIILFATTTSSLATIGTYWLYSNHQRDIKTKFIIKNIFDKLNLNFSTVHARKNTIVSTDENISYYPPGKIKPDPKAAHIPKLEDLNLVNVQVFYRHGARTPLKRLPGLLGELEWNAHELFKNSSSYTSVPCKWLNFMGQFVSESDEDKANQKIVFNGGASAGLLTTLGHEQIYELGTRLKNDYILTKEFVKPHFNCNEVYARCTNINRMKCSSHGLISSMFHVPVKIHDDDSKEVVIAIEELNREFMFPNPRICPPLIEVMNAYLQAMNSIPQYLADLEALKKLTNIDKDTKLTVTEIYDTMKAADAHGIPRPLPLLVEWDSWMEKFERYVHQSYNMLLNLDKHTFRHGLRWSIGPVLDTILANMRSALTCSGFYKMELYAIHDSTLNPLLMVLGNFRSWVPFAADLIFEVYRDTKSHEWVRILYLGKPLILPGAENEICSMAHFINVTGRMAAPFETFCSEKHGPVPEIKFKQSSFIGI